MHDRMISIHGPRVERAPELVQLTDRALLFAFVVGRLSVLGAAIASRYVGCVGLVHRRAGSGLPQGYGEPAATRDDSVQGAGMNLSWADWGTAPRGSAPFAAASRSLPPTSSCATGTTSTGPKMIRRIGIKSLKPGYTGQFKDKTPPLAPSPPFSPRARAPRVVRGPPPPARRGPGAPRTAHPC